MEIGHWITLAIFVAGNLFTVAGVVISNRIDTNTLKGRMNSFAEEMKMMKDELKQFGDILLAMADFKGELKLLNERQLAQGKRMDDTSTVINERLLRLERRMDPKSGGG